MPARDIFVSYASPDSALADRVCGALEQHKLSCWIAPRDVMPGAPYASEIVHAIDSSRATVLILSQHAAASPHVLREVERATSRRHPVIALRIGMVRLPAELEYFLNACQWLDTSAEDVDRVLPRLIAAIHAAVTQFVEKRDGAGTPPVYRHRQPAAKSYLVLALLGVLGVGAAWFTANRYWPSLRTSAPVLSKPATAVDKSVAVLPFVDMSEKKDQEYFSDGLSEELIDRLAHAKNLKVIARTSSFQFKGKNEDMRSIGQRLGVANLLEGSVRTSGNTIRVTAQLISVADGTHVWSETYDRKAGDVFKVQDEIATAVVAALKANMAPASHADSDLDPSNIESHNKVLLAKYFNYRNTQQDSDRALEAINEALKLQPDNATAWMTLADIFFVRAVDRWMPSREAYAGARKAIDRALQIDPNLPAAHNMLGSIEKVFNNNDELYRRETQIAVDLDPTMMQPLSRAVDLYGQGKLEEAMPLFRQAADVNPLDTWTLAWLGGGLYALNRLTEAEVAFGRILQLQSDIAGTYCPLGRILLADHKPAAALDAMAKEPDEANRLTCMPAALWAVGRRQESDTMLAQAKEKYQALASYELAYCYAFRGEKDEAFKWLDRAYDNHDLQLQFLNEDPDFRSLHSDPRFAALIRKLNQPRPP